MLLVFNYKSRLVTFVRVRMPHFGKTNGSDRENYGFGRKTGGIEKIGKQIPMDIKQRVLLAIANIEYGSVEIIIHGGKVVQIECREKTRIS